MRRTLAGLVAAGLIVGLAAPAQADAIRNGQWYVQSLKLAEVHAVSQGVGVTVAVIDTGVDGSHLDLAGNVLKGANSDLTGDGWMDKGGHGTGVASLIAGHGHGTNEGILGIAPQAKVLPIGNSTSDLQKGPDGDIAAKIDESVRRGAKVISMAFVGGSYSALEQAIQRAQAADVVLVAGTGNVGDPQSEGLGGINYPAKYPGVLAVTATGRDGNLDPISVTGKGVLLSAPGADLNVASSSGGYRHTSGTSLATGVVAGAVAVVRSKFPHLSAKQVIDLLTSTATDKGAPGLDNQYGYGGLDLLAALRSSPAASASSSAGPDADATRSAGTDGKDGGVAPWQLGLLACMLVALAVAGVGLVVWLPTRHRRHRNSPGPPPR